ncbi:Fungal-type protein kinase domain-containing protein [Pleurotus pulmonarius]
MMDHVQGSRLTSPPAKSSPVTIRGQQERARSVGRDTQAKLRDHIAEQMEEEFSIVSVEEFMSHYLPFEPTEEDFKEMEESLAKMEILVEVDGNLRFHEFLVPPCRIDGTYRPLDDISRAIASVPVEVANAGLDNNVDGCFTSESPDSTTLDTYHLACILEYKLDSTQEIENNKQAVSASVQIMNDDVRRMFTYGITIVEDRVTLWYHSRSHSMISTPFSFVENPRLLIKVFMSFLFATEEELGYDPMVTRDAKGDYIYRIPSIEQGRQCDRFFRTTASIAEYRSNNITGRMGRVWKAVECNPNGDVLSPREPFRVLKDVWLEDSALTESQIQSQIFADIKKFFSSTQDKRYVAFQKLQPSISELEHEDRYQKYFITIVTDYEGKRTKPLLPNSQRKRRLFSVTTSTPSGSGTPCPPETKITFDERPREFALRKQYRVIFGEVCEAVGDLGTVGEVADVLSQAVVALRLMYCAGWVHRDISSGNILAHRSWSSTPWQAKLSDLEYARQFSDSDRDLGGDPKTGTPYFMPHEMLCSHYIPLSPSASTSNDDTNIFTNGRQPKPPKQPLVYNYQHDLESIWWIFLWTVLSRVPHEASVEYARPIFQNIMTLSDARSQCLLEEIEAPLQLCLHPSLKRLSQPLDQLRELLHTSYLGRRRKGKLADVTSYVGIHRYFVQFFNHIKMSQATWGGTALVAQHPSVASFVVDVPKPTCDKRPRNDETCVPDAEDKRDKRGRHR